MIGFGNLVGSLSHSVLYLHGVLPQHSPSSDFGENQLSRGLISLSLLLSSHLRIFQHPRVRSFTACYCSFNLLKSRSPPLRVYCPRLGRAVGTRFPFASTAEPFRLAPRTITRRLIMQKASSHPVHSKSQPPTSNIQRRTKLQITKHRLWRYFGACVLGFLWGLEFGAWSFHSIGFRMDRAPTHCRHMVAGTISLR